MGNCLGREPLQGNQFRVKNINDDKRLVQKGLMEVTAVDLMYTDSKTHEVWQWPLKYLRKYGCDGDVFSFEAGRKCPGGEGLYAFSTPKASQLFDLVAQNITQDSSHPPENLSPPFAAEDQDHSALRFPPGTQTQPSDQPNYLNMGPNGAVLLNVQTELTSGVTTDTSRESSVPKPESPRPVTPPGPPRFQYREVVFQKPPEEHPVPVEDVTQRSPYSKINFEETQKRIERRNGALQVSVPLAQSHTRVSSSSVPGDRRRNNTFPASTSKHSISSGSLSSQTSLTESVRETRIPRANGGIPQSAGCSENMTYQNLVLGQQPNYQNVNVGGGDTNHLTSPPLQQPNYENLSLTSSTGTRSPGYRNASCPPSRSTSTSSTHHPHPTSVSASALQSPSAISRVPLPEVLGNPMAHYAELDLSGAHQRTSTPRDHYHHHQTPQPHQQSSYLELGFPPSTPTPGAPTPAMSPLPEGRMSPVAAELELQPPPSSTKSSTSTIPAIKLVDDKVNYGVLDFETMKAISELQRQRELDNQAKKEREEQLAKKEREKVRDKDKSITQRRHTHHK